MEILRKEAFGVVYYACDGFSGVAHGFSTRLGGVSPAPWDTLNLTVSRGDSPANVGENFRRFCRAVGADACALVKNHQVHSDRIRTVSRRDALSDPGLVDDYQADGLITDEPGVCLTVFSADCIPVLLYDPKRRVISAVHAGWRGTALGIAGKAAKKMVADYGCAPGDILAAIGPGISSCCFETHGDVPDGLRAGLGPQAEDFIRPLPRAGKFSVDLKGANRQWLLNAGLTQGHIAVCAACTACDGDTFWSHRILGDRRGSMAASIQLL